MKYFKTIKGKFYSCKEDGELIHDENGLPEELESTDGMTEVTGEDEAIDEVGKMLAKAIEKQGGEIAELKSGFMKDVKGFWEAMSKGMKSAKAPVSNKADDSKKYVEDFMSGAKKFMSGESQSFVHEFKSVEDLAMMQKTTSVGGNLDANVIEDQRVPEITRNPVRPVFIEQIANTAPMTSDKLTYVEATTETGAPATTAELASAPEKDFSFETRTAFLKKITVANKHSKELLADAPQLVNAIRGWLNEDLNVVADQQLLTGTGVGTQLNGVFNVATAFSAGGRTVVSPNLYDVIRVAITQILVAGAGRFFPNYVLLNPVDAESLDLVKDSQGRYIMPSFSNADGTVIKGVRVLMNTAIPAGQYLIGDFNRMHVGFKGGVELEATRSDGEDFKKGIITILLTRRLASYVRTNEDGAFVTDTIADSIAELTA